MALAMQWLPARWWWRQVALGDVRTVRPGRGLPAARGAQLVKASWTRRGIEMERRWQAAGGSDGDCVGAWACGRCCFCFGCARVAPALRLRTSGNRYISRHRRGRRTQTPTAGALTVKAACNSCERSAAREARRPPMHPRHQQYRASRPPSPRAGRRARCSSRNSAGLPVDLAAAAGTRSRLSFVRAFDT